MKRLIKKAEFYDASNIYNKYVEFYINPNSTEIKQIRDLQKQNGYDVSSIRMFINDSGRIYAWDGYILHSVAKGFLTDAQNDIHFAIENFGYIHSVGQRNRTQFVNAIKNAKQNLQNAGINENCALEEIFKSFGSQDDFSMFKTLKDIYDFEEEAQEKTARLIKKADKIYLKDILKVWDDGTPMVYDTDYYNRDNAFVIYNGKLYEAETHERALAKANYTYESDDGDYSSIVGSVLTGTDNKTYIAVYDGAAFNMTIDDAIPILKDKYPNAIICTDSTLEIDETAFIETVAKNNIQLIKKAEFYDADNLMNNMKCKKLYTEFYINPDNNDINKILKYQKEQTNHDFDGIRMFLNNNGRIYAWSAYVLHSNAKNFLKDASSDMHLAYDISSNEMSVDGLASWDEISFLNAFKNAKSNFEKAGINENCNLDIYYSFNNEFKTLKDVYNFELQEKTARLIKKASKIYLKDILDPNSIKIYGENTDYGNRDFAISYINGKLYDGETHKDTVTQYLNDKNQDPDEYLNYEEGFVTPDEQDNIDNPMGFASYVKGIDSKDYIAIYPDSLFNLSIDMFVSALKNKYSTAIICEDNSDRYRCYENGTAYIETI